MTGLPSVGLKNGQIPSADASSQAPRPPSRPHSSPSPPRSHRIFAALCGVGTLRARYTIAKFRDFNAYCRSTSSWRRALTVCLTPLPSILTSVLPTLIPLQDRTLGVSKNTGYMFHCGVTLSLIMLGSVFQIRAPSNNSHRDISNFDALLISWIGSFLLTAFVTMLGYAWRFPVPFIWVTAYVPFVAIFVVAHILVLRSKLFRDDRLRGPLLSFLPSYFMQGFQVVIYPAFSALFEISDELGQVALTLFFPFIKFMFRRILKVLSSHLAEDADEVAVSGVEICAVMYQSMIMQNSPSPYATVFLIGIDVLHGLFTIHVFMDKRSVLPQHELVREASDILCKHHTTFTDDALVNYGTIKKLPRMTFLRIPSRVRRHRSTVVRPEEAKRVAVVRIPSQQRVRTVSSRRDEKQIVTQALEIIQSAESILLVEYFEVTVPVVNAIYLLWASQLESAIYNPMIRPFYYDQGLLGPAIRGLALYAVLQGLSVVAMHHVMWYRYRVSATALLAYVLERHAWSLQGKLITWLAAIFQLPVMHYGVDFTMRFDFSLKPPLRTL